MVPVPKIKNSAVNGTGWVADPGGVNWSNMKT